MDKTTPRVTRKTSSKALRAALRKRQKVWRQRRKAKEVEALKLLEQIPDDAPIIVIGKHYKPEE